MGVGFLHVETSFPALHASMVIGACQISGMATTTASTSGALRIRR